MTTEKIEFDVSAMHAVNTSLIKYLDGMKVASALSETLTAEEKRQLARATEDFKAGHYNAALTRYKSYSISKRKLPTNNNTPSQLDVIVQYLICKCLLQSENYLELSQARSMLIELEESSGITYPMIYLSLAEFHAKVFCFDEANRMATKGLALASTSEIPICYLPESNTLLMESTTDELIKQLTSLKEECSGWHPPDAKCFMKICRETSQNHICGRDIFVKSPAYNGMVTVTCSNATNPCEIHFHCACWKIKKDEASSVAKISDKEVLLNWECFTPNCGTEAAPSVIKKILIHREDGSVIDIEPQADKSHWHAQQGPSTSKGATRKRKQLTRVTNAPRVTRAKHILPSDKVSETSESVLNAGDLGQEEAVEHPETLTADPFDAKIVRMMVLRDLNFYIDPDFDWRPNKMYYGNEHVRSTIDSSYEPDFSDDEEHKTFIKSFLFSYFLSYIERCGAIKNDDLMREWNSLTASDEFNSVVKDFNGIVDVRKFLLQSLKFVAVGNYICIPARLEGTYALVEQDAELRVMEMMEKKTFDFSSGQMRWRKKPQEVKLEGLPASDTSEENDCSSVGDVEESSETNVSCQGALKTVRALVNVAGDVTEDGGEEFVDEGLTDGASDLENEDDGEGENEEDRRKIEELFDSLKHSRTLDDKRGGMKEMKEEVKEEIEVEKEQEPTDENNKNKKNPDQQRDNEKPQEVPAEIYEDFVIETESEGTLDDQDDLPWDGKTPTMPRTARESEKIAQQDAMILALEEELEIYREELRRSAERLEFSEAEHLKTKGKLQDKLLQTEDKLQQTEDKLLETEDKLLQTQNQLLETEDKLQQTEDKLLQTEDKLLESDDKLLQTQDQLLETEDKLQQTEDKLLQTQDQLLETEDKLLQTQNQLLETEDKLQQTEDKLLQTEDKLLETDDKLLQTQDQLLETEDKLQQTEDKLLQTQDQLLETEDKLQQTEDKLLQTQDQLPETEDKLQQTEDKLLQTQDELDQAQNKFRQSEDKLKITHEELQKTLNELQTMETKFQEAQANFKIMESELETCREELKLQQEKSKETIRQMSRKFLDREVDYNLGLLSYKIEATEDQYRIAMKLHYLVQQITNSYLIIDWTKWTEGLNKIAKLRKDFENDYKQWLKVMKSDGLMGERQKAFRKSMQMLKFLPLPPRNITDLVETAGNMIRIHLQQAMVSCRPAVGPQGVNQAPPIIPVCYQPEQPRYTPPSTVPCSPCHPMNTQMMQSSAPQYHQSAFPTSTFVRPEFPVEYSPYGRAPLTITDILSTPPSLTTSSQPFGGRNTKMEEVKRGSTESISSEDNSQKTRGDGKPEVIHSRDAGEAGQGTVKKEQANGLQVDPSRQEIVKSQIQSSSVATENKVPMTTDVQMSPVSLVVPSTITQPPSIISAPQDLSSADASKNNGNPGESARDIRPPSMKATIVASSSGSASLANGDPAIQVEAAKSLPASTNIPTVVSEFIASVAPADTVNKVAMAAAETIFPGTSQTPGFSSVAQSSKEPQQKVPTGTSPPATKPLTPLDQPVKAHTRAAVPPQKAAGVQQLLKSNETPANARNIKKPKMQSMDKLMYTLRNKHPGVLEYDLIWSIKIVRKNHNDSLTGLPLVDIIAEADKLLAARQKLQLIPYTASSKVTIKNQGIYLTTQAGSLGIDLNCSTSSGSPLHRDAAAKKNPWSKPRDVSWHKEAPEAECVICWESLVPDQENSKPTNTLKCQHTFHDECVNTWFNQNRSCPTCRVPSIIDNEFPPLP